MAKVFKLSDKAAIQVTPIQIEGKRMIDVRQMYRTQKQLEADDKTWMRGFKGLSIPMGEGDDEGKIALKVAKAIREIALGGDAVEYVEVSTREDDEKPAKKSAKPKKRNS